MSSLVIEAFKDYPVKTFFTPLIQSFIYSIFVSKTQSRKWFLSLGSSDEKTLSFTKFSLVWHWAPSENQTHKHDLPA